MTAVEKIIDADTGEVIVAMSADEATVATAEIKAHIGTAYAVLAEVHHRRGYRAMGYSSFPEYAQAEFDISKSQAYRLLDHAHFVAVIEQAAEQGSGLDLGEASPMGDVLPERVTRDLKADLDEIAGQVRDAVAELGPDPDPDEVVAAVIVVISPTAENPPDGEEPEGAAPTPPAAPPARQPKTTATLELKAIAATAALKKAVVRFLRDGRPDPLAEMHHEAWTELAALTRDLSTCTERIVGAGRIRRRNESKAKES